MLFLVAVLTQVCWKMSCSPAQDISNINNSINKVCMNTSPILDKLSLSQLIWCEMFTVQCKYAVFLSVIVIWMYQFG
jgi:hypothetical protein